MASRRCKCVRVTLVLVLGFCTTADLFICSDNRDLGSDAVLPQAIFYFLNSDASR